MPTYHTGSVRYHVSEFLSDRHPYNPATGSDTQRQREAGLVKNSHESVAFDKLQEDLIGLDDPNEKVKALRALLAHASSAENKITLIRKGLVPRLAATLMQARKQSNKASASAAGDQPLAEEEKSEGAAAKTKEPHIQQLAPFKVNGSAQQAWAAVEATAAQLFRSLCVIPQGVHCVIEEGGWTALVASVADTTNALKEREAARICAATAIALLTSTGAALNWLSTGAIDGPSDLHLEGYTCSDAYYTDLVPLYGQTQQGARKSSATSSTITPDAIGTQPLVSIDNRELILSAFFDTAVAALTKEQGSPKLLVSILDAVGNLIALERCLHLALIAGLLRSLSSYMGNVLLKDDLWLHTSGVSGNAGATPIVAADSKSATPESAAAAHLHPGSAPVNNSGAKAVYGPQIDIASKISNILWHIGLDSVGKQEILELYQIVFQTGKLLQLLLKETAPNQLLALKALVSGALGSMALLPEMKKLMTSKKDYPIEISPKDDGTLLLNGNKDANGLERSVVDSLLELLRSANDLMREKFPHVVNKVSEDGATSHPPQRLSVADTALKRDLDAVITNSVATLRLIAELPATRNYLHSKVFLTNNPPVNVDGPALTIAAAQEGKEHELRRQLFYSTRWEKEFKVYVY